MDQNKQYHEPNFHLSNDYKSYGKNKENDEREQDFIDKDKSPINESKDDKIDDDDEKKQEEKMEDKQEKESDDKIVLKKPKERSATKNRIPITPTPDSVYNVKNYYRRLFARNKKPAGKKRVAKAIGDKKVNNKKVTKKNKETLKVSQMGSEIRKIISKVKFEKTALEHFLFYIKNMSKTVFDEITKTAKEEFKSKTITEPLILYYLEKAKSK